MPGQPPSQPSGLGWLPDGSMLIVSTRDKRILKLDTNGKLSVHADLASMTETAINDMVVSESGHAYVGSMGMDLDSTAKAKGWKWIYEHAGDPENCGTIFHVDPSGRAEVGMEGLMFPNGPVILPGGRLYLVGETFGHRISACDVARDGKLSNRRTWAPVAADIFPDGVAWDPKANALWVGNGGGKNITLVAEGGAVLATVSTTLLGIACALDPVNRNLYICTAPDSNGERRRKAREAKLEVVNVAAVSGGKL
ncbi:SMP-30/gluconolaconase/LRE-like region family protein 4 [Hyaloraphidium curvatum]|nr:SMP-30/gluconolaconase/LRE-like region family protein 4 [Hyaloraphidium curvatum]